MQYITSISHHHYLTEIEYIIQCNDETKQIWQPLMSDPLVNMSVLFDPSCGLGVRIREFPVPPSTPHVIRCGYAGNQPTLIPNQPSSSF